MRMTPAQQALWANRVQHCCLLEAGEDIEAGLAAAEYILSTEPPTQTIESSWTNVPDSFLDLIKVQ